MAMNHAEIDAVLAELSLEGALIQQIWQPSFETLIMECHTPTGNLRLKTCLKSGLTRFHTTSQPFSTKGSQPRFAECLRARLKDGRILSVQQLQNDRIIEITVQQATEQYRYLIRLWSNAANACLCQTDGTIIDAWFRRPNRNEISGGYF